MPFQKVLYSSSSYCCRPVAEPLTFDNTKANTLGLNVEAVPSSKSNPGHIKLQMFIGDGAKLVRDAFALAKEKAPTIIFIDELDAIGTKRFDSEKAGDREVQRTMLELLNQLDGFSSTEEIKVTFEASSTPT